MPTLAKTANAAYKDYRIAGGTLSFTEWLQREKDKMYYSNGTDDNLLLIHPPTNDTVQTAIKDTLKQGGLKDQESGKTFFGIPKVAVIGGAVVLSAIVIFLIVKNVKKS